MAFLMICVSVDRQPCSDKAWKEVAFSETVHDTVMDGTGSYMYCIYMFYP